MVIDCHLDIQFFSMKSEDNDVAAVLRQLQPLVVVHKVRALTKELALQ